MKFSYGLCFRQVFRRPSHIIFGNTTQIRWKIMVIKSVFIWARAQRADAQCTTSCLEELLCLFSLKKCFLNP